MESKLNANKPYAASIFHIFTVFILNHRFSAEVTVKGAVVLDYVILGGVSNFLSLPNIRNTLEYNAVQYDSTTNYDLNAKEYNWIYTFQTKSTRTEHYKLCKG